MASAAHGVARAPQRGARVTREDEEPEGDSRRRSEMTPHGARRLDGGRGPSPRARFVCVSSRPPSLVLAFVVGSLASVVRSFVVPLLVVPLVAGALGSRPPAAAAQTAARVCRRGRSARRFPPRPAARRARTSAAGPPRAAMAAESADAHQHFLREAPTRPRGRVSRRSAFALASPDVRGWCEGSDELLSSWAEYATSDVLGTRAIRELLGDRARLL